MSCSDCQNGRSIPTPSYNYQDWIRIRDMYRAVRRSEKSLQEYSDKMENTITKTTSFRESAAKIQNKQIGLEILRNEVLQARRRLRNTQLRFSAFMDKLAEDEVESKRRHSNLAVLIQEVHALTEENHQLRISYRSIMNELTLRRQYMIYGLYRIFFIRSDQRYIFKNQCCCEHFDEIRGLHMPQIKARLGHSDSEMAAALGVIVCLMETVCKIIGHPLTHTLCFAGSRSSITARSSDQIFPLFPITSRKQKERERFDIGLHLLNETICELRNQAGLATSEADRPIRNLREFLLACIGVLRPSLVRSPRKSLSPLVRLVCHECENSNDAGESESESAGDALGAEFANRMVKFLRVNEAVNDGGSSCAVPPAYASSSSSVLDVVSPRHHTGFVSQS